MRAFLGGARLPGDPPVAVDQVGLVPQRPLPFGGLLQQMVPGDLAVVRPVETAIVNGTADRLVHVADEPAIDRHRSVGGRPAAGRKGTHRDLQPPGTFWEYNDVRVHRLSLALLRLWQRPLPDIFRELVMEPIGASPDWEWHGYRNSYVEIAGERMQSVSGGSHWGGGVFIHARDQARIGLLMQRGGMWGVKRILSEDWVARCLVPCSIQPIYGYLWWLNTGREMYPSASDSSYFASGAGGNLTWIDPQNDVVAVLRWIDPAARDGFMHRVMSAITG